MSTQAQALQLLDAAVLEAPLIPWKLQWSSVIARLRALVMHPELLHQRALNACGPAVFFRIWFARDPLGAATFGYRLLKSGAAYIGPINVVAGASLLGQDYVHLRDNANLIQAQSMPEDADWMLLSALRQSENVLPYSGEPHSLGESLAAVTLPMTVTHWLEATNLYSNVVNRTTVVSGAMASMQFLNELAPSQNVDVALFMNSGFGGEMYPAPTTHPPAEDGFRIPNHYVQLLSPVVLDGTNSWMKLSYWTWGQNHEHWTGKAKFLSNFFGGIIATV